MLRGASWRQEQAARLAIITARMTAVLMRQKRIPSLDSLLEDRATIRVTQSPQEQRALLVAWAKRAQKKKRAVTIGRLERPFDPRRLDPATSPSLSRRLRG